jgi:outer membrane biosynthesis protein TonB
VPLDVGTLREPSAAAVLPIDVTKKKGRSGLTIAIVASVSIAIAAAVMFYFQQRGAESVDNVTAPPTTPTLDIQPAAATTPADANLTAPRPEDETPAAVATDVPKPADEIKKVEPAPAPPVKKPGNKKPKPAVAKKPPDKPYDKVRDPKHVEKAKDPKDELAKPAPPPVTPPPATTPPATKRDVYATPRAEK